MVVAVTCGTTSCNITVGSVTTLETRRGCVINPSKLEECTASLGMYIVPTPNKLSTVSFSDTDKEGNKIMLCTCTTDKCNGGQNMVSTSDTTPVSVTDPAASSTITTESDRTNTAFHLAPCLISFVLTFLAFINLIQ